MNYNEISESLLNNYVNPCDAQVKPGQYRRVKWELYNKDNSYLNPKNKEEWDTEIIDRKTRVYNSNPFGHISTPYPKPSAGPSDPPVTGVWSTKIGIYFSSQTELESYVKSIGSTLLSDNNWYGADLSKADLFKTPIETDMYLIENAGGVMINGRPSIDTRTMLSVDLNNNISINYNGTTGSRIAYMKYYENTSCKFTGIKLYTDVDMSLPGIPVAESAVIGELPYISQRTIVGCVPFRAKFPYNGLTNAILEAWNKSSNSFKLYWDMLPGIPQSSEGFASTMYNHLSCAMEELGAASLQMCQYVQQLAWAEFKKIISNALNIVGAGWELLKSFLPKITILDVSIDIEELCMSDDAVGYLRNKFAEIGVSIEDQIKAIYLTISSTYEYAIERVKMTARDIVTAITDLYDWCWSMLMMAGVALSKLLTDIAQIWSMPPIVPNPIWSVITAVKAMMSKIEPLSMIMSGNFPGFTSAQVYEMVMTEVNKILDATWKEIKAYKQLAIDTWNKVKETAIEYKNAAIEYKEYISGMYGSVVEEIRLQKESLMNELKNKVDYLKSTYNSIKAHIIEKKFSVHDILTLAITELKKLPIVSHINELLSLLGSSIDDMIVVYENSITQAKSLYIQFTDGASSIKDLIKSIYVQICTLSLSKVTQWINKLLHILGLEIIFPEISICIPYIQTSK